VEIDAAVAPGLGRNWSKTTIVVVRIHKTGITYLSKLVEIDAAVAPGLGRNWSKTTTVMIRIHKTGITYLSKLVEIDAAVAPGLGGELEQDNLCRDSDPQDRYHLPF
jgi:hypothetical protein